MCTHFRLIIGRVKEADIMQQEELNKRIDQAVQGDRLALEEVLTEIQDMVFNLSLRMLGTIADAQDAAQEILIKVVSYRCELSDGCKKKHVRSASPGF